MSAILFGDMPLIYAQPTKQALRDFRGVSSIYHMNGIQTWQVHANGEVENVETA